MSPPLHDILDCRAASLTRTISHDYLINRIRSHTASEDLRSSLLACCGTTLPMYSVLLAQIDELIRIIDDPADGYSPAQLISQIEAFQELSPCDASSAVDRVHCHFLHECGFLSGAKADLAEEKAALGLAIEDFLRLPSEHDSIKEAHRRIDVAAKKMIVALRNLPRGVCL